MRRMTNEEAIEVLDAMKVKIEIPKAAVTQYKRNVSLDMAIEALSETKRDLSEDDLISRQAAIDAMANTLWHCPNKCYRNLNEYEFAKGLAELGLKSVPSAQPEKRTNERTGTHACDLISRQAAIAEVKEAYENDEMLDGYEYRLQELLSVQSEPLRINLNEWIKVKLTDYGKDIYYHRFDELNKTYGREIIKPRFPREDENGYARFQLWEFIQLYGPHINMGVPKVIDPIDIVFERKINAQSD